MLMKLKDYFKHKSARDMSYFVHNDRDSFGKEEEKSNEIRQGHKKQVTSLLSLFFVKQ